MPQFKIDTREVEELFLVPLNYFMNPNNYRLYTVADESLSFARMECIGRITLFEVQQPLFAQFISACSATLV